MTHEGNEIRVPIDNLTLPEGYSLFQAGETPDGFMPTTAFKAEVDRRATGLTKGLVKKDELLGDDDFFRSAAQKRGISLSDDLKPVAKFDPETLNRYKSEWEKDEHLPTKQERDELKQQNDLLRRENVTAKTQTALLKDLTPKAFTPDVPGLPSTFDAMMSHFVKFDDEGKAYFQADPAGMPDYDIPKAVLGYVKKAAKDLIADNRPNGGGYHGPAGGEGRVMSRARFDALSQSERKAFALSGGQITD